MRDGVPYFGYQRFRAVDTERCNDTRSFSIHTMEAFADGLPRPTGSVDLRTCDHETSKNNDLLIRAKYLSSVAAVNDLEWEKNFERGREDFLEGVVVEQVENGIEYMRTNSDHYIHTLPPPRYHDQDNAGNTQMLVADILKRMKDCNMFTLTSSECRYKSDILVTEFPTDVAHATALVSHLLFEFMPDMGVYDERMKITVTDPPSTGTVRSARQRLSDVLKSVSQNDANKLISQPFQCWFEKPPGTYCRIVPNKIRWGLGLIQESCDEVFKYVKPYFYCSSFDTTRLVPYKPAIGIFVDRDRCPSSYGYLIGIIRVAAKTKGLVAENDQNFVDVTHELAIQYFDVKGKNDSYYLVTGGMTNPEENGSIHAVLESIMDEERWVYEKQDPVGPSIMTILDRKSPVLDDGLRNSIVQSSGSEDTTEAIERTLESIVNYVRSYGSGSASLEDLKREFPAYTYLDVIPDTVHIPGKNGGALYRVSVKHRAYSTQTQCCLNIERLRSECRFTGYVKERHEAILNAFNTDDGRTTITVDENSGTLYAQAHNRYADLVSIKETLEGVGLRVVPDSERYMVTHNPRIIPDAVPSRFSVSMTGTHKSMRRTFETERQFAVRAASIHPDMICFNLTTGDSMSNEVKKFLKQIDHMKNMDIFNSGSWQERLGFGAIVVHMVNLVGQTGTILFTDGNKSFVETIVSWIFGAFDKIVDAIQDMGPGDSLGDFLNELMEQEESTSGLLGRAFENSQKFLTWENGASVGDTVADKLRDTGLEAVQGVVHTAGAMTNPLAFVLDLLKDIPFLSDFTAEFTDAIETFFACVLNPIQIFMLGQKLNRILFNMYTKYDRKRLQNLRQHSLTYASFVNHLTSVPEIVALSKLNLYGVHEDTGQTVVREMGRKLTPALMHWSQRDPHIQRVGFTSITNTYYRNSRIKCFVHNRMRCAECHKVTIGFETATANLSRALRRASEWGNVVEDVQSEVVRLRARVRDLEMEKDKY